MTSVQGLRGSRQLLLQRKVPSTALLQALRTSLNSTQPHRTQFRRHASSSSNASKPIVLEQPDKFRPPSHPQKYVRSRPGRGGAYNQSSTTREQESQQTRKYPHMFPNEGTFMYWFLTTRSIHLWLTLGVLFTLASFSLTQTFIHTSPYAHLLPPLSSLLLHPINFFSETWAVARLHMDYRTIEAAESRAYNVLDAQKRRIFRRANGLENLDEEEDQGVDVRGIVPWDDGLTNPERARGGRSLSLISGRELAEEGLPGETLPEFAKRKRAERAELLAAKNAREEAELEEEESRKRMEAEQRQRRKRKVWFGIW